VECTSVQIKIPDNVVCGVDLTEKAEYKKYYAILLIIPIFISTSTLFNIVIASMPIHYNPMLQPSLEAINLK